MKLLLLVVSLILALYLSVRAAEQPNLPSPFDVVMLAGADYLLSVQIKNSYGAQLNMTDKTYAAQFRANPAPAGVLYANFSAVTRIPYTTYSGVSTSYPAVLDIKLSAAQTRALSGKSGVWDLRQTDTLGLISYILAGKCTVRPTVTQ